MSSAPPSPSLYHTTTTRSPSLPLLASSSLSCAVAKSSLPRRSRPSASANAASSRRALSSASDARWDAACRSFSNSDKVSLRRAHSATWDGWGGNDGVRWGAGGRFEKEGELDGVRNGEGMPHTHPSTSHNHIPPPLLTCPSSLLSTPTSRVLAAVHPADSSATLRCRYRLAVWLARRARTACVKPSVTERRWSLRVHRRCLG